MDTNTPINPEEELPAAESHQELPEDTRSDIEKERDEYKEGWMRAKADFTNYKRTEQERISNAIAHGLGGIIEELLRVLDSFQLARTSIEEGSAAQQGMDMIRSQFLDILKRYGVEPIPSDEIIGKDFDPVTSEAIGTRESADHPEGSVVAIAQEGYRVNGKVFRPVRVYLATAPQSPTTTN